MEFVVLLLSVLGVACAGMIGLAWGALIVLAFVGLFLLAYRTAVGGPVRKQRSLEDVAEELGLQVDWGSDPQGMSGTIEGVAVDARMRTVGSGKLRQTSCVVEVSGLDPAVAVGQGRHFGRSLGVVHETGDQRFDANFRGYGEEDALAALLDDEVRGSLLALDRYRTLVRIEDGQLYTSRPLWGDLIQRVRTCVALAHQLAPTTGDALLERLVHNATTSAEAAVRQRVLEVLVAHYRSDPRARAAFEAACADADAGVRLAGATGLSEQGADVLESLVGDGDLPAELRAAAADAWSGLGCVDVARIVPLLDSDCEGVVLAAVHALGARRAVTALSALLALGAGLHPSGWTEPSPARQAAKVRAVALAKALGNLGDPSGESLLVDLLGWDDHPIQEAAAQALGRAGTLAAVEPLLRLAEARFETASVKKAARGSIIALQDGVDQASSGALSLMTSAEEAGALSLADDDRLPPEIAVPSATPRPNPARTEREG